MNETVAIITGASSGIGKSMVKALINSPDCPKQIWVIARRIDRLEELGKLSERIIPVKADLSDSSDMGKVLDLLKDKNPDVRLLVNSAGMGRRGNIEDRPSSDISDVLELNCVALSVFTAEVLPFMSRGARIINLASSAAFLPQPGFAVYAASKSYVVSFSRALSRELKPRGIKVTAVCPGPVDTEFNGLATDGRSSGFTGFRRLLAADADKLASASFKASGRGRVLFVYGFSQKALHVASKILPVGLLLKLIY